MLFDSHCHLDMLDDAASALERAAQVGVDRMITIGVDLATSEEAVRRAGTDDRIFATIGLHPHDARLQTEAMWSRFEVLARDPRCVGIGEAGLDYHYEHSPRDIQRSVFERHVQLAAETDQTLVIHTREAWDETWEILRRNPMPRTVFHCFTGGAREAEIALELGAVLSFSGIVTFKNAEEIRDAARLTPLSSMLVETDSPFLAPIPHRGRPNEPGYLVDTVKSIAQIKGLSFEEVAAGTVATTERIFALI